MEDYTCDLISDHIALRQSRKGYRFGLDALLLATDLPDLKPASVVYDFGAAQGPVALSIAARRHDLTVIAVERQDSLFAYLEHNIEHNAELLGSVEARQLDLRDYRTELSSHQADLVITNPPYFPQNMRRPSQNPERASARHELHGTLADFIAAGCYVLKPQAWFKMILPPWRLPDLFACLVDRDLNVASLRPVHASPGEDAYLLEILMRRSRTPTLDLRAPLMIRSAQGHYTPEVAQRLASAATQTPSPELLERLQARTTSSEGAP